MTEELTIYGGLTEAQKSLVEKRTPPQYIKERRGRGGTFSYVEVGYVIDQLNQLFNFMWDFEVLEEKIGLKQIWVKGKLTAHIGPGIDVVKTAYGGIEIKVYAETTEAHKAGEVIDIADDLKAAASDALKKAASLIGVASDIYWQDSPQNGGEAEAAAVPAGSASEKQRKFIFKLGSNLGLTPEGTHKKAKAKFGLTSFTELTKEQASELIEELMESDKKEAVVPKEIPEDLGEDNTIPF